MDDPGSTMTIILVLILVLVNAFFAMSKTAVISFNDTKLRKEAEDGNKKAKRIAKIVDAPNNFLTTVKVAKNLSGFLAAAFAAIALSDSGAAKMLADFIGEYIPVESGMIFPHLDKLRTARMQNTNEQPMLIIERSPIR